MRLLYLLFALLTFSQLFAQDGPSFALNKEIQTFLGKTTDGDEIEFTIGILNDDIRYFRSDFDSLPLLNPVNPKYAKDYSSKFGKRFHPIDKVKKMHNGIDIPAEIATAIHASGSGIVIKAKKSNYGYGNEVVIAHSYGFTSRYAHMYSFIVKEGTEVKKGDIIGFVGSTGKSTAPHVHFEIRKNNKAVDPVPFMGLTY